MSRPEKERGRNPRIEPQKVPLTVEGGVSGFRQASGYIFDEFLTELRGIQGRRKYREMLDNDPIIGGIMSAIEYMLLGVEWHCDPADEGSSEYADWLEDTLQNMPGMTWHNVISESLSMLGYGFAVLEIIAARKPDGTIGLEKLAPRAQDTIDQWDVDDFGNVYGVIQQPWTGGGTYYIPGNKILHFKTSYAKGNPEGRSILRNAYRSYHFTKNIQMIEAIAIERELNGLPVMYVPSDVLADASKTAAYLKIVRDIKFNEQGAILLPSETYPDADGNPSNVRMVDLKLLASEGSRNIDTGAVIRRHQADMARTVLADFIMLGEGKGSYALSQEKTELFLKAIESIISNICQEFNRKLVPTLWMLNGFPEEAMPKLRYGRIAPEDLTALGDFVAKLSGSGMILSDRETEEHLRRVAGLPQAPEEGLPDESE